MLNNDVVLIFTAKAREEPLIQQPKLAYQKFSGRPRSSQ